MNAKRVATRRFFLGGLVLALVAATIVIAVIALRTGKGSPTLILLEEQPLEKVVAVVEGQEVAIQDIRDTVYHSGQVFGAWPEQSSIRQRTFAAVDAIIIDAEVKRRGLTPTNRQAWEYFKPYKDACLASEELHCRDFIESLGYEVEEYWTLAFPGYKRELGRNELTSLLAFDWEASGSAIDEDPSTRINDFYDELRRNASIDWRDKSFRIMYEVSLDEERQRVADFKGPETPGASPPVSKEALPGTPTVEECLEFFKSLAAETRTGSQPVDVLVQVEGAAADRAKRMLQVCDDVFREAENAR